MFSKDYCNTIPVTCSRVLNSSPGRLDLGGLGFKSPREVPPRCPHFGLNDQTLVNEYVHTDQMKWLNEMTECHDRMK